MASPARKSKYSLPGWGILTEERAYTLKEPNLILTELNSGIWIKKGWLPAYRVRRTATEEVVDVVTDRQAVGSVPVAA